jgi:hypothetical protein
LSLLVILSLWLTGGDLARADVLKLRDGRQWEGTIVSETGEEVVIRTVGGPVAVPKSEIAALSRGPSREEQYAERRRAIADGDVAGHLTLARWCRERNLVKEAQAEYQVVLTLDPENAEAHQALGHQQVDGRWLTFEEAMAARGLVQHEGRWLEPAQAAQAEKEESRRKQELEWRQRVQGLVRTILSGTPAGQGRARAELLAVDDLGAAAAVMDLLRHPNLQIQLLALTLVEKRGFPGGDKPLVEIALGSKDPEVARLARLALVRTARGEALRPLVEALGNARREVRHRAAVVLGEIGDPRVVPFLIDAIREPMPVEEFSSPTVGLSPNQPTEQAIEATTAPGVAVMMPKVQQFTSGTGISAGGTTVAVRAGINYDAVDALEAITSVQLGGDQAAWGRWWAREGERLLSRARPRQ